MLSRKEVNQIRRKIRQKRLRSFRLENEVVDFVSCAVEDRMAKGEAFQQALDSVSADLGREDLVRAQKQTVSIRKPNTIDMLQNYLKIAWRNFFKYRVNTAINILGLVMGLSTSIVIGLYLKHEFSHDSIYPEYEQLYRVNTISYMRGRENPDHLNAVSSLLRDAMVKDIPEITHASNLEYVFYNKPLKRGEDNFFEYRFGAVHQDFFEILGLEMVEGKVSELYESSNGIFLSEKFSKTVFGKNSAWGQMLTLVDSDTTIELQVLGVFKDLPANTHFQEDPWSGFDVITSAKAGEQMSDNQRKWGNVSNSVYMKLAAGADEQLVIEKLNGILEANMEKPWYEHYLQPLRDLHLNQRGYEIESTGNLDQLYLFSIIAILILLIACINYVNLTTAQASVRLKEVGIRKVIGARRRQFVFQFLTEAVLMSLFSMLLALVLVYLIIPFLNSQYALNLEIDLTKDVVSLLGFLGIMLIVSLLCGTYPGFYLSRMQPHQLLKSGQAVKSGGGLFRKVLVVMQYATSITLIIATLVITNQLRFISEQDLGFDQEQVVYVDIGYALSARYGETLFNEFSKEPGVMSASLTGGSLVSGNMSGNGIRINDMPQEEREIHQVLPVDWDYKKTMGIEMKEGRWFEQTFGTDRKEGYIVNEAFVRHFDIEKPLGTPLIRNGRTGTIVGVVKDFHFRSMRHVIEPLVMFMSPYDDFGYHQMALRLTPNDPSHTVERLKATWEAVVPDYPFKYIFLDEQIDRIYKADREFANMFTVFSGLAIVVSCLGLIGLVSFSTMRRSKEIGVRKVLGATVLRILQLISLDLVKLITIGAVVAIPLGYFFMNDWLDNFQYRTSIAWWIFAVALMLTVLISWLAVSYISLKAARANPVDSLRTE